eukprot:TRINITY_DN50278_c0_g1_i1.p1 TRINITY_DN50278_c0_g1~~TRINITY_DN50278_c0_g1_i1.p1  ORF type:complete len:263 (-),score=24.17 TRINITY_DN50278_c0_g1_i1:594-1382(-)
MVVDNRVAHIRSLVSSGVKMFSTVSMNPATNIEKIKITLDPHAQCDPRFQSASLAVLDFLDRVRCSTHVADRGHHNSRGQSEVIFYISHGKRASRVRFEDERVADDAAVPSDGALPLVGVPASQKRMRSNPRGGPSDPAGQDYVFDVGMVRDPMVCDQQRGVFADVTVRDAENVTEAIAASLSDALMGLSQIVLPGFIASSHTTLEMQLSVDARAAAPALLKDSLEDLLVSVASPLVRNAAGLTACRLVQQFVLPRMPPGPS